uniref:Uncharacterized protein n=1 Tax=Mycobacterium riyadhense TaxID=486698 RepID=A0A653EUQ8_9MYCO|nr:hypothetical protein BIN_B_03968 [Mycobacterium riyadhense]
MVMDEIAKQFNNYRSVRPVALRINSCPSSEMRPLPGGQATTLDKA